ncbi:MAG: S-adenosylmethionine:tRNA ribosyltransferase-isomerase [Cytophagaceae bacterium]|jgi:S-adenosylmethionine:tRNA ribosyltransferase-isomerase|nr:S-adenosylmethionine:tRNA ribosyltransferase-isomerase [Cytophagaceae bacterium]
MILPSINSAEYDYALPAERIAKFPLNNRDDSKLLIYNGQTISETVFSNLPDVLPDNALLVFNNTKVIRARLRFFKATGACIEIFCLEPHAPSSIELAFKQTEQVEWVCMAGNLKKWKEGEVSTNIRISNRNIKISATIAERLNENLIVRFCWNDTSLTFADILEAAGQTPIPPYLEREAVDLDAERYQTVYSKYKGSVAAPTAGLHFTVNVLQRLSCNGIQSAELTLHVGAGTFKPVKSDLATEHRMHTEHFTVSLNTLKQLEAHKGQIIAVGTTSVRTLESLYIAGVKRALSQPFNVIHQWDGFAYPPNLTMKEALGCLINYMEKHHQTLFDASTSIMIVPGYKLKAIDGLITNFHQPRSTLLLLIAAFVGNDWKNIYRYAINNHFRFLSYGDSSLLMKQS